MRRNAPVIVALVASAVFLVGCTPVASSDAPEPTTSQGEPAPTQSEEPEAELQLVSCEEGTQEAIEQTISSQTSAFADDNFELAYSFASPTFRSTVSLEGFVLIIASSYGPLIESSKLRFSDCIIDPDSGFALIDVSFLQSGEFVYALRYLMNETRDGWKVEGASNLAVVGEGT